MLLLFSKRLKLLISYLGIFHTPSANNDTALKSPASIACRGPPYSHSKEIKIKSILSCRNIPVYLGRGSRG